MKIFFLWKSETSFEKADLMLLKKDHEVRDIKFSLKRLPQILQTLYWADILYFWFPGDYKLLILLFGKFLGCKVVCVGGGQMATADTKADREYAGVKYRLGYVFSAKWCVYLADRVIAVSTHEFKTIVNYSNVRKVFLVHNLINFSRLNSNKEKKTRENICLTISNIDSEYFVRKGLDTFAESSRLFPSVRFCLVGKDRKDGTLERINKISGGNVAYLGRLSDEELGTKMKNSKVYCQFSRQEGFGVALAEAMRSGCIPVVSRKGAIMEVAGPCAYYISEERSSEELKSLIPKALEAFEEHTKYFEERVAEMFGVERRRLGIKKCLDSL